MRGEHVLIVKDEGNLRRYFIQIPNIIDDANINVYAFRLYVHLKRVAGDDGKCWQSVRTLSMACNMSKGMITKARQELEDLDLIKVFRKDNPRGGRKFIEISIKDIWAENFKRYSKQPSTHKPSVESTRSPHGLASPPGGLKNNPIKNNTSSNNDSKESLYKKPPLTPSTPSSLFMFERLKQNAMVKGRRGPTRFNSLECKEKFDRAEFRLGPKITQDAIIAGLENGITSVPKLTNYVSKWRPRNNQQNQVTNPLSEYTGPEP